jgi:type I restriction enzyme S subunit
MDRDWHTATVAELQREGVLLVEDGNHGEYRPRPHEIGTEGRPHIRAADLADGRIDFAAAQRINDEASARISKGQAQPLDVILSHKGTVGRVGIAPEGCEPFVCSPQTTLWRAVNRNQLDPRYLHAQLRSHLIQGQLRLVMNESDMAPYVSLTSQRGFRVCVPPIEEQRAIASVLGVFDDKIESNRRLMTAHERAAATLVERVVRFGMPPVGWSQRAFSEAVVVNPRVRLTKGHETPFVEMAAVAPFATRPTRLDRRPYASGCKFEPGDTLMARITGCIEHGKGTFVDFVDEPGAGSTEFIVFRPRPPLTSEIVFFLSRDERLRAHAITSMTGTSGRQRVDNRCFDTIALSIAPASPERDAMVAEIAVAMRTSHGVWTETRTLTAIRDALLPKLVSGQIRVPLSDDPEERAGAAAEALG